MEVISMVRQTDRLTDCMEALDLEMAGQYSSNHTDFIGASEGLSNFLYKRRIELDRSTT